MAISGRHWSVGARIITEIEAEDATKTLLPIARYLIEKGYRYLEPKQAGYIAGRCKVSRQQVEAAPILADRMRRKQQQVDYLAGRGSTYVRLPEPVQQRDLASIRAATPETPDARQRAGMASGVTGTIALIPTGAFRRAHSRHSATLFHRLRPGIECVLAVCLRVAKECSGYNHRSAKACKYG